MHIAHNKYSNTLLRPIIGSAKWLGKHFPETLVRLRYFLRFHKKLNLDNPQDLNEKILYMSLRTDTSLWTPLSDKYAVRKYIEEKGLADILVKCYGVYDNIEDVDWDKLPDAFVIKTTHGCGDVKIVRDKHRDISDADISYFKKLLAQRYGYLEGSKHYPRIKPRVVIEELLDNDAASQLYSTSIIDYKFWCFDGEPHYCFVTTNRTKQGVDMLTYDIDWTPRPEYSYYGRTFHQAKPIPKPEGYERMIEISRRLSQGFPCLRVDLYNIRGKIYFGELTFTNLGGMDNTYTPEFLLCTGSMIHIK